MAKDDEPKDLAARVEEAIAEERPLEGTAEERAVVEAVGEMILGRLALAMRGVEAASKASPAGPAPCEEAFGLVKKIYPSLSDAQAGVATWVFVTIDWIMEGSPGASREELMAAGFVRKVREREEPLLVDPTGQRVN